MMLAIVLLGSIIGNKQQIVMASSASITLASLSDTIQIGDTFSVSVTLKSSSTNKIGEVSTKIKYDTDCMEFSSENGMFEEADGEITISDAGTESNATKKYILQFKAMDTKVGRIWIEGTPLVYNSNGNVLSVSKNVLQVSIGERTEKSGNKNLSSLVIKEGTLDKKFSKSETSYTMTVPQEVKSLTVLATPENANSKVTIKGADKLLVGENNIVITVTSETKRTKDYNIVVTRGDIQSSAATPKASAAPGENKEGQDISENQPSKSPEPEGDKEQGNRFSDYEFVSATNLRSMPKGYLSVALTINQKNVDAYQLEDQEDKDMYLVYAKYQSSEPGFYMYDQKEGTLQRFVQGKEESNLITEEDMVSVKEYNDEVQKLGLIIGVCAGVITMLLICVIRLYMKSKGYTKEFE